jgi:hypothetical protein
MAAGADARSVAGAGGAGVAGGGGGGAGGPVVAGSTVVVVLAGPVVLAGAASRSPPVHAAANVNTNVAVEIAGIRINSTATSTGGGQSGQRAATTSAMSSPASVGFWATRTPAADRASILAWAVPLEPEMIAPA